MKSVVLGIAAVLAAGCAKVAEGPLTPLLDPPVRASFDTDHGGWEYHYAEPAPATPPAAGVNPLHSTARALFGKGSLLFDFNFNPPASKFAAGPVFSPPADLTGRTLSLWVLWDSGLFENGGKAGCKLFLWDDVSGWFVGGPFHNLLQGKWVQVTFDISAPSDLNDAAKALPYSQITSAVPKAGLEINLLDGTPAPGKVYVDQFAY